MGLDKKRLEQSFVRLDLPLQLLVFLRPEARLPLVGEHVVDVDLRAVGAKDRLAESSLLKTDNPAPVSVRLRDRHFRHSALPL